MDGVVDGDLCNSSGYDCWTDAGLSGEREEVGSACRNESHFLQLAERVSTLVCYIESMELSVHPPVPEDFMLFFTTGIKHTVENQPPHFPYPYLSDFSMYHKIRA